MTTILLVEDDKNQRLLYEQELGFEGYEIVTAADGKDALKKVQEQPFDLVVMDINLLKMDGIETMGWILSKYKNIPIIINTAYSSYKDNFMTWAADAFIVKSSDLTELKNKIKEIIINKSQRLQSKVHMNSSTEKRKYERIELEGRKNKGIEKHFMARFKVKQYESLDLPLTNWDTVDVKNLSAGGMLFNYNKNQKIDSLLDLKIDISESTPSVNCAGKIIRVEELQPHSMYHIATEFTEIDKQEKEIINTTIKNFLV
jgi:DNA-binding response OmpR family regulator